MSTAVFDSLLPSSVSSRRMKRTKCWSPTPGCSWYVTSPRLPFTRSRLNELSSRMYFWKSRCLGPAGLHICKINIKGAGAWLRLWKELQSGQVWWVAGSDDCCSEVKATVWLEWDSAGPDVTLQNSSPKISNCCVMEGLNVADGSKGIVSVFFDFDLFFFF